MVKYDATNGKLNESSDMQQSGQQLVPPPFGFPPGGVPPGVPPFFPPGAGAPGGGPPSFPPFMPPPGIYC